MDWFSYLKLRGSWGKLGNERIGAYDDDGNFIYNYYPYQAAIDYSTALFQNSQGIVSSVTTAAQQKYAVRDISWETTESWDIGLDANFLDNRLHFSADYYRKIRGHVAGTGNSTFHRLRQPGSQCRKYAHYRL